MPLRASLATLILLATGLLVSWTGAEASSARTTLSPSTVARRVAAVYGEKRPHVVYLQRTETDSTPHQPMYVLEISGRFHRGARRARYLYFSALARRWYVWGVVAYNASHKIQWIDKLLPQGTVSHLSSGA